MNSVGASWLELIQSLKQKQQRFEVLAPTTREVVTQNRKRYGYIGGRVTVVLEG